MARATRFPARKAARVGARPAKPTTATTTRSTSGAWAMATNPSSPTVISTPAFCAGGKSASRRSRASAVATFSHLKRSQGASWEAASARGSTRVPAAIPTSSNRPG